VIEQLLSTHVLPEVALKEETQYRDDILRGPGQGELNRIEQTLSTFLTAIKLHTSHRSKSSDRGRFIARVADGKTPAPEEFVEAGSPFFLSIDPKRDELSRRTRTTHQLITDVLDVWHGVR